ncbi:MAG: menaquinone biosynthesis decarboxylase [Nitrospirae bacterium]|nr:MAG: menaquinone biosynthesis decarboxylase [Nitrospirota bacterium]
MAYPSMREFIDALKGAGELVTIEEKVSPILEITEITDRVSKSKDGGKALLFKNVEGSSIPLLINAFGSSRRINIAFGVKHIEVVAERIAQLITMRPPGDVFGKIDFLRNLMYIKGIPPKIVKEAPCQEVVYRGDDVDLNMFPILKCWPKDGGRFITMPVVFTKSLKSGCRNAGMYRMQVYDKKTTGMHWQIHKDGSHYFSEYVKANKRMEVAVAIGTDPVVTYAATAPMPRNVDEMFLAGFIRGKRVELVKCKTVDLEVPATAEIVLEGYVDPNESRIEGPFGDHTGYYSLEDYYPVFHITAITTRRDPIYLTTIVGKPPMEDCYLGKATERIFLPLLKTQLPELVDMNLPWEGVFHNCVVASIEKHYPLQSRKVMSAMWGLGQMSFSKMIALVDPEVHLSDMSEVVRTILDNIDIEHDLYITEGILDVLDHSSPTPLYGGKVGVDATTKIEGEPGFKQKKGILEPSINMEEILTSLKKLSKGVKDINIPFRYVKNPLAIVGFKKSRPGEVKEFIKGLECADSLREIKIFLLIDDRYRIDDYSVVAWKFFNNTDPRRDFYNIKGHLVIDATKKLREEGHERRWPDDIEMDESIKRVVEQKLHKYGSIF